MAVPASGAGVSAAEAHLFFFEREKKRETFEKRLRGKKKGLKKEDKKKKNKDFTLSTKNKKLQLLSFVSVRFSFVCFFFST